MEKILETIGISVTGFEVFKIVAYYSISAVIKSAFAFYTTYFIFLSIVRSCDNYASPAKKRKFRNLSFVGIVALIVFFGWGYNPIIFLVTELVMIQYWNSEEVSVWKIIRQEWEEDWLPRIHNVVVLFKTLTRH